MTECKKGNAAVQFVNDTRFIAGSNVTDTLATDTSCFPIICANSVRRKCKEKIKQMTMVRTFQACEAIVQTATVKGDEDILRVTGAGNNDLVAAEARHHKDCLATYINKNNLHYEGRQETSYDVAFQQLSEYMSTDIDGGKAFETPMVIGRYKEYLNEQHMYIDSYTTQRLKIRLKKHFSDKIVFHQPYDRTISELLYSIAISDIPSRCHQLCLQVPRRCNTERMSGEQPSVEMVDCDRV